jgi:putative two-component system response regulator
MTESSSDGGPLGEAALKEMRVLIVDDQQDNVLLLEVILQRAGYKHLKSTTDPRKVLNLYHEFMPDLLLLDLNMPHMDGYAVMGQLAADIPEGSYFPILVLTADITAETKHKALAHGAKDFLTKPFDLTEVQLRIKNLLATRHLHLQIQAFNEQLEERVRERTRELEEAQVEIIRRLARAAEYRDDMTGKHTQRVGRLSARIAQALGLPEGEVELIRMASLLHDVGKIGVSDTILLKPDRLTEAEYEAMKSHSEIGADILSGNNYPLLRMAEEIALTHHERWDGTGYPRGLKGEEIPLSGRIVAVVDVFDALTHDRPYKEAWTFEEAVSEIRRQGGRQFDPRVVEVFSGTAGAFRDDPEGGEEADEQDREAETRVVN